MNANVLVVDDEDEICRTIKNYLELFGYKVITAPSGEVALRICEEEKIHIALLDIKMPGMDGITLLEHLKKQDFSIQVIMMTGYSTFQITLKALEKGATDYILKPFEDMEEIATQIKLAQDKMERWRRILAETVRQNKGGNA
jgi:two-component system NtrC family response regulator